LIFIALIVSGTVANISVPGPTQAADRAIAIVSPTLSSWNLSPEGAQPMIMTGQLGVLVTDAIGTDAWQVTASDLDTTNTNGHMTEYSGDIYNIGTKLSSAMQVQGPGGIANLPGGGMVVNGLGNNNQEYTMEFGQSVQWSDPVSNSYRIVVTFTAGFTP
jgi:hypothetical protein